MIGIIGRKLGMTQIFNAAGQQIPCTVVEAAPNPVTKVMTKEVAGFDSIELGVESQRTARDSKKGERTPKGNRAAAAELGHAAKAGLSAAPRSLARTMMVISRWPLSDPLVGVKRKPCRLADAAILA